tara:strand:+ start:116 stop:460 length:345 start_codon:yes stop_codon:yes gene_type:complete
MNSFLKTNKNLITYGLIFLIIFPFFGLNMLLSLFGNFLLLIVLLPILLLIIGFIIFNSFRSKVNVCSRCGTLSLGLNTNCVNCGEEFNNNELERNQIFKNPSESTIEVKAEEIK